MPDITCGDIEINGDSNEGWCLSYENDENSWHRDFGPGWSRREVIRAFRERVAEDT